ncbi:uncharacterized protein LOC117644985 [Thrips palmi]|uniref:Uncharacterized protein LOC117644985 n=1 Tax=Thrips palmi TaxID=161013 RepID=A0A6P8ZMK1_THRPL|nr:uncharacterized protein LOC117644985 [Thrips palmi]XP_034240743.1 uncharacterized protein LOC117644985 [Thrips palmi]XP_034240744.1 uncharacterized protein LOC117644985 [Thrips palmi]
MASSANNDGSSQGGQGTESRAPNVSDEAKNEALFWENVSLKTKITLPSSIVALLKHLGFDNETALRAFTKEKIEEMENFMRKFSKVSMHGMVPSAPQKQYFYPKKFVYYYFVQYILHVLFYFIQKFLFLS